MITPQMPQPQLVPVIILGGVLCDLAMQAARPYGTPIPPPETDRIELPKGVDMVVCLENQAHIRINTLRKAITVIPPNGGTGESFTYLDDEFDTALTDRLDAVRTDYRSYRIYKLIGDVWECIDSRLSVRDLLLTEIDAFNIMRKGGIVEYRHSYHANWTRMDSSSSEAMRVVCSDGMQLRMPTIDHSCGLPIPLTVDQIKNCATVWTFHVTDGVFAALESTVLSFPDLRNISVWASKKEVEQIISSITGLKAIK